MRLMLLAILLVYLHPIITLSLSLGTNSLAYSKKKGAFYGLFFGDSLAISTHWIYNVSQIQNDYGIIRSYVQPKQLLLNSKLVLSTYYDKVIGNVVLKNKKHLYRIDEAISKISTPNMYTKEYYHYHYGLSKGGNSLEVLLLRLLLRNVNKNQKFIESDYLEQYKAFMTSTNSHNDSYTYTCHRMFFYNHYYRNLPLIECADNDGHNIDGIDGLVCILPIIFRYMSSSRLERNQIIKQTIRSIRKTRNLDKYAEIYSDLLISVLTGKYSLQQGIEYYGSLLTGDDDENDGLSGLRSFKNMVEGNSNTNQYLDYLYQQIVSPIQPESGTNTNSNTNSINNLEFSPNTFSDTSDTTSTQSPPPPLTTTGITTACYIEPAFTSLLYLAYKYSDKTKYKSPEIGLLMNANLGGENTARGCLLGCLLGAEYGYETWPSWCKEGLISYTDIEKEVNELLSMT